MQAFPTAAQKRDTIRIPNYSARAGSPTSTAHGRMMALPPLLGWALSPTFVLDGHPHAGGVGDGVPDVLGGCVCGSRPLVKRRGRTVPAILTHASASHISPASPSWRCARSRCVAIAFAPFSPRSAPSVWKGRERSLAPARGLDPGGGIMGPVAFSLATADGSPAAVTGHAWAACTVFTLHYVGAVPLVLDDRAARTRAGRWGGNLL